MGTLVVYRWFTVPLSVDPSAGSEGSSCGTNLNPSAHIQGVLLWSGFPFEFEAIGQKKLLFLLLSMRKCREAQHSLV